MCDRPFRSRRASYQGLIRLTHLVSSARLGIGLSCLFLLWGCRLPGSVVERPTPTPSPSPSPVAPSPTPPAASPELPQEASAELLRESWEAYRQRFIQVDGRVIDWEAEARSTSESQAYAMLRAVLIDDPETFARTLQWGEDNLRRKQDEQPTDNLWAWRWGQANDEDESEWGILDQNFAIDADIDAATALILAARRWNRPDYLPLAQAKLADIWNLSTVEVEGRRYLLPGPIAAFQKGDRLILNPSYYAPYAFRLFAQIDPERNWQALVEGSYDFLNRVAADSPVSLPSDWVAYEPKTQTLSPLTEADAVVNNTSSNLITQYAFDAYRVWWRVALDEVWFGAPEASAFLDQHLNYMQQLWQDQGAIPAQMNLAGEAIVNYEATSQYGMLYAALRERSPLIAREMFQQKLFPRYQEGLWDDESAYYSQNLAWLGLFPPAGLPPRLLSPAP